MTCGGPGCGASLEKLEVERRPEFQFGVATMCIGVGQGIAMVAAKVA